LTTRRSTRTTSVGDIVVVIIRTVTVLDVIGIFF
jgi:hypothetical protein